MKPSRSKTIRGESGMSLTVYPWDHPVTGKTCWRFAWRETPSSPWRYTTASSKAKAEAKAAERIEEMEGGGLIWTALPAARRQFLSEIHKHVPQNPDAESTILDYLLSRKKSDDIGAAVSRFLSGKVSAAGEESPYIATVRNNLETMAAHFAGKSVADIQLPELAAWLDQRAEGRGWKLKSDVRGYLVEFWRWCQIEGLAGREPVTVAARLPRIGKEEMERRVLTPEELQTLLANVGVEWRAWVVLGAFAGMRPEEIVPHPNKKKRAKRGLLCEEIDWDFNVIRLPACVSKVDYPRNIPISAALKAGLKWAGIRPGMTGPVVLRNPSREQELARLGKVVFETGWPKDALRHSYGSYRNAIVRSLEQVSQEMGTSVSMLQRHYHNPKAEAEGEKWFAVRFPLEKMFRFCSDGIEVNVEELENQKPKKARRIKKRA